MSRNPHPPALSAFLAGRPVVPLGYRRNGSPIWPIAGGADDDDPQRPDDVPETDWDALGDPGKKALVRERAKVTDLQQQLAAAKARPAPPSPASPVAPAAPAAPAPVASADQHPDLPALIKDAVAAAVKPFQDAEQQRQAETAATAVRTAVMNVAKGRLHDATDGLMIDLTTVVGDDGKADAAKIGAALDDLVKAKPHLVKDTRRFAAPGVGPTPGGATPPMKDQVQAVLAQMQSATGIRAPKTD